jgi:hypothetical protein
MDLAVGLIEAEKSRIIEEARATGGVSGMGASFFVALGRVLVNRIG